MKVECAVLAKFASLFFLFLVFWNPLGEKVYIFPSVLNVKKCVGLKAFLFDTNHSSLQLYKTVYKTDQSVYQYSDNLCTVKCYRHRRILSRFRCGCHGLYVDTPAGRFANWQGC